MNAPAAASGVREGDVLIFREGAAGVIRLNRPKAINALTVDMVRIIMAGLDAFESDPGVSLVLLEGAGERGLCAGGDIRGLYDSARAKGDLGAVFWREEYILNARIPAFPKPYVAFMDGLVMGGGVGLSAHAAHRIVTGATKIGMPEAGLGFFPDVGGTWLLARAPGRIGEYLALTGARMEAGDAIHAGFADLYIPAADWPDLIAMLQDNGDAGSLRGHPAPPATLDRRDLSAFGGRHVPDIIAGLEQVGDTESLNALRRNSPLSMAAGLAMVRAARGDDRMQQSLSREYRFTARATAESDFLEGVRAQIIDKDRKPVWRCDASEDTVRAMLALLGDDDLQWENAE